MENEVPEHEVDEEMAVNDWREICEAEELCIDNSVDSHEPNFTDIGDIRLDMKLLRKVLKCQRLQLRNSKKGDITHVEHASMVELLDTFKHYSHSVVTKMEKFLGVGSQPRVQLQSEETLASPLGDNPEPLWDYEPDGEPTENPDTVGKTTVLDDNATEGQSLRKMKPIYVNEEGVIRYLCPACNFTKKSEGAVYTHLTNEHNIARFQCKFCQFTSGNKHSLHNHERGQHVLKSVK